MAKTKKTKQMVMVGVWANRNWILGNWIREVKLRLPSNFRLWWVPSIYAGKRPIEKFLKSKGIKYYEYELERVKPKEKVDYESQ